MGSFYDARLHDPAADLHDLMLEVRSDIDDAATVRRIEDCLLRHYQA